MKKLIALAVLGTSLGCSSMAMAEGGFDGLYLKGGLGYVMGIDETTNDIAGGFDGADAAFDFDADSSIALQFAVGFKINEYLTTEVSLQHNTGYDISGDLLVDGEKLDFYEEGAYYTVDSDLDTTSLMATAIIDFAALAESDWAVKPYAGLGVGYAKNSLGNLHLEADFDGDSGETDVKGGSDSGFAWKVVAGATFPINKNLAFDASYQYADYGSVDVDVDGDITLDVKSHELMFALKYML